ncbi:MAG: hypothetical protein WKF78_09970 [Candidatus Limnocylindrales bacterium]
MPDGLDARHARAVQCTGTDPSVIPAAEPWSGVDAGRGSNEEEIE